MSNFPENKGYVAAKVISTTQPTDKAAMWFVGSDMNSVTDIKLFWNGQWTSIENMFSLTQVGVTAPANKKIIWLDSTFAPPRPKTYNSVTKQWEFVFKIQRRIVAQDFTIDIPDDNYIIDCNNASGTLEVSIVDVQLDNFMVNIHRIGDGSVVLKPDTASVNGQYNPISISNKFGAVSLRRIDTNQFVANGNL